MANSFTRIETLRSLPASEPKPTVAHIFFFALLFSSAAHAKTVRFAYAPPNNGQQVTQTVQTKSNLQTTFTQSNQLISSEQKKFKTEQVRKVTILEGRLGHAAEVHVTYAKALRRANFLGRAEHQAVAGKTYAVRRETESAELEITYLDGSAPPPDELVIVDANMQAVGKHNPIAQFLDGRSVDVGEELTLPPKLAAELLSGSLAKQAESVTLRLQSIASINDHAAAIFSTTIVGRSNDQPEPSFRCEGQLSVAIGTCRTLQIDMNADVAFTEQRGPDMAPFEVTNVGTVAVKMLAQNNNPALR